MLTKLDDAEKWAEKYEECISVYEDFGANLRDLIENLLSEHEVPLAQIEYRIKTADSFLEKIKRKGESYRDPLFEVTDLCGIRIICYFLEDVERIGKVLEKEFEIDVENSTDKSKISDPERFGYLSVHYVLSLNSYRKQLTEWKSFSNLKAEVQVRTVLQHAWAAIDHKLRYKSTREVPKELRRQLFRLSALLELADAEFSTIKQRSDDLAKRYASEVEKGEYDIEMNLVSMDAYLRSVHAIQKWRDIARECGFATLQDQVLELEKVEPEKRRLLRILQNAGISSIQDFDQLLKEADLWGRKILQEVRDLSAQKGFVPFAIPYDVLTILVIAKRRELLDKSSIESTFSRQELQAAVAEMFGDRNR